LGGEVGSGCAVQRIVALGGEKPGGIGEGCQVRKRSQEIPAPVRPVGVGGARNRRLYWSNLLGRSPGPAEQCEVGLTAGERSRRFTLKAASPTRGRSPSLRYGTPCGFSKRNRRRRGGHAGLGRITSRNVSTTFVSGLAVTGNVPIESAPLARDVGNHREVIALVEPVRPARARCRGST